MYMYMYSIGRKREVSEPYAMRVLALLLKQIENVRHAELRVYNRAPAEERHLLHHAQVQRLPLPPTPVSDAPLPPTRHQVL